MDLKDLKIDPEFAEKIPPLTEEEFTQLEANILAEGALLSPMIVWNGVIVDGHNRYRILQEHPEITFEVREKEFENRFEAIAWICRNQLGRRNLTEIQKRMLIGKQYEAEKASVNGAERRTLFIPEQGGLCVCGCSQCPCGNLANHRERFRSALYSKGKSSKRASPLPDR